MEHFFFYQLQDLFTNSKVVYGFIDFTKVVLFGVVKNRVLKRQHPKKMISETLH